MKRLTLGIFLFVSALAAKTFTLEQVLSAPFPSELVAAPGGGPSGGKVAWMLNERGARNVWIAAAPDWKGVRVTSYTADDGTDIGQLCWTPDGHSVVFTRGGDLEFLGRADPNPSTDTSGVEQDIMIVGVGEPPRKIAEGHTPALSPKGDRVAFLRNSQIWLAPLTGPDKPVMLYHARNGVTSAEPKWSPDGSQIAFVSDRGNHSFIAVYDFASKQLTYLDPSVDYDRNPVWSPDGTRVAFLRTAGAAGRGQRAGEPWSIRVANATTGVGRQVWIADRGDGSVFHAIVSESQLFWASGNRIVFPWEKDGWCHLYSVPAESGEGGAVAADLISLTPGAFEVEHVSFSDDRKELIFSSNQDDIDRRHIWRVSAAGGPPKAVTNGKELEWLPVFAGGGVAFLHADTKRPARAAIQLAGKVQDLAPASIPADFPAESLVDPQQVIYSSPDGMQIHAQLFLPPGGTGQKHKALVFMHGGSRRQMLLGWHYMDYYNNAYGMNQYLASQGYVVLSINYRSGIGYGMAFREAVNFGPNGGSEFNDVEGAGLYLRTRQDVQPDHIGLWGGSYGGYLTAMGLAHASNLFAAGVDFHGVHDWSARGFLGGPVTASSAPNPARDEAARTAFDSSPMAAVKTWYSPVLLIHGDDDRNVNFDQTVMLVAALRAQGTYFEQLILPDEIHGFLRHGSWLRAYHATVDFFGRKL
jgi:dipeptidyl aminopeptidase/acylaminoacyl peptidase